MKKKVMCVVGTRPEVIKMAPAIWQLKKVPYIDLKVLSTAQHREMLDDMLRFFDIQTDIDLDIMEKGQTLPRLTAKLPIPLDQTLEEEKPDLLLAQGDTTTAFMVSLASFYQKIPVAHIEAGLRTNCMENPFPEEMNRVLISRLSSLHFAPTQIAKENLLREGCEEKRVHITGNTVIDALDYITSQNLPLDPRVDLNKRLILVTAHRRESHGENLYQICNALKTLADSNSDVQIFYPVHPNPKVYDVVHQELKNHPRITLTEPLEYLNFVSLMQHAYLILSDSGGVQEEAPTLKTPVVVLREKTERPEGVMLGAAKLVGRDTDRIVKIAQELLDNSKVYQKMLIEKSPYGDGSAGKQITKIVGQFFDFNIKS